MLEEKPIREKALEKTIVSRFKQAHKAQKQLQWTEQAPKVLEEKPIWEKALEEKSGLDWSGWEEWADFQRSESRFVAAKEKHPGCNSLVSMTLLLPFFFVSFDLPSHIDIWGHIWRRLAEMGLVYGGIFGTLCTTLSLSGMIAYLRVRVQEARWFKSKEPSPNPIVRKGYHPSYNKVAKIGIVLLIIAVACLLLLRFVIPLALTFWGQMFLIGLLIAFWLPLLFSMADDIRYWMTNTILYWCSD